jgi:hypothetical protein
MRALPDLENREVRAGHQALSDEERRESEVAGSPKAMNNGLRATTVHERYGTALTEGLVMAGRDGVRFKRWNEAFVRPGIERTGTWNYGQCYLGWHAVETRSAREGAPNELSIYSSESYWIGEASRWRRYTLRVDGFVSVQARSPGAKPDEAGRFFRETTDLNFSTGRRQRPGRDPGATDTLFRGSPGGLSAVIRGFDLAAGDVEKWGRCRPLWRLCVFASSSATPTSTPSIHRRGALRLARWRIWLIRP